MSKIIPFPAQVKPSPIDWKELEVVRELQFPKIHKKALVIIQRIWEEKGTEESYFLIHDTSDGYPPDPITITPCKNDVVWVLDLLDRFGGELCHGSLKCTIRRSRKRPPLFFIQKITEEI